MLILSVSSNKKNKTKCLLASALTLFIYSQTSLKEVILSVNYLFAIDGKDPELKISTIKKPAV
jgi:hypothetical protein